MEIKVGGSKQVGTNSGAVFQIALNGKQIEEEVYSVRRSGIYRLAGGPHASLLFNPPMPLLRYPIQNNAVYTWHGMMKGPNVSVPAKAYYQVSGPETISTAAGRFQAYQVDMAILATVKQQSIRLPSVFWFAPNVGMIMQETNIKGSRVSAKLHHYVIK
ncbi:MAG: hypothetical protein M1330_03955 [Armatimonadetes bacterium]|nr:hypothetical protein [Armatimonadota bacterium]